MRLVGRGVAGALLAMSLVSAPLAHAADPKRPEASVVAQARVHFERAVKLYAEDDYRAALIEFSRAYEIAPNWVVLYNVGQSYYQLREYPNALGTLEKYIAQGGASIPAERRAQVDHEIEELRGRVAHVTVESTKEGAEIALDDVALGRAPLNGPQLVGAGRHTFRATKAGLPAVTQVVDIAGGDAITVRLTFPEPVAPAPSPPPPPPPAPPEPVSRVPAYVAFGVGGAGVVAGTVFGILALGNKSSLTSECPSKACPASAQGDLNAYSRNGAVSTVGFTVAGAGVATGVVLYLLERGSDAHPPPAGTRSSRVEVAPWIGLRAAGLGGSF